MKIPSMYRYSPYYSDHDAICATIKQLNNIDAPTPQTFSTSAMNITNDLRHQTVSSVTKNNTEAL